MRGEYRSNNTSKRVLLGSPPLARGIRIVCVHIIIDPGITPACAGNTGFFLPWLPPKRDHPRLRGEYYLIVHKYLPIPGSPPLARGIRAYQSVNGYRSRITPACAGNTVLMAACPQAPGDHPRLRGEYYYDLTLGEGGVGSPPLARGILECLDSRSSRMRITPACAGNTGIQ